ncbi:MAG TPA: hypothetical protein PLH79_16625, partial [bacterium]|nr:hypothetical protein [bacterium]
MMTFFPSPLRDKNLVQCGLFRQQINQAVPRYPLGSPVAHRPFRIPAFAPARRIAAVVQEKRNRLVRVGPQGYGRGMIRQHQQPERLVPPPQPFDNRPQQALIEV